MTTTRHARARATAPSTPRWALAASASAIAVLVVLLLATGGAAPSDLAGIDDPGALTRWGLPLAGLLADGAATVTIGFLLLAVLLPAPQAELGRDALRALRIASLAALVWAAATATLHLLTLSDLLGVPLSRALQGSALESFSTTVRQGQATTVVVILAITLAVSARFTIGQGGAFALLLLGLGTLVPPAITGHAATGDYHHSASVSLLVHVVAVALWVGGLVAVSWYAAGSGRHLVRVLGSYSAVALASFVAVTASGVLNAYVRLSSPLDLVTSTYGWLLLGKVAAVVALGWFGWQQRQIGIAGVAAGRPRAFRRLAGIEVVVMAVTIALGVALSRTAPPAPDVLPPLTQARDLLGFPPPTAPPTLGRIVSDVYPDAVFALGCLGAVLLYGAGVWRLRRRGDRWPVGRTVAWAAGVAVVAATTLSGLMSYGMVQLSVHMVQHMVLAMVAPVLLVLGAPITLALRAVAPAPRGERGVREALLAVVQSRPAAVLTNPVVALALFVTAPFTIYFTGAFEYAMRNHTAHILMNVHFLLVGYLFAEVLVGLDPLPRRPPYPFRLLLQLAAMGVHAFFGVALANAANLVAGPWFRDLALDLAWLPDPALDQERAGSIAWGFGEVPGVLVLLIILVQWMRSDDREARRKDRAGDAELTAYNAYLSRLSTPGRSRDG